MEKKMNENNMCHQAHALIRNLPHVLLTLENPKEKENVWACRMSAAFSPEELSQMLSAFFARDNSVFEVAVEALIDAQKELRQEGDIEGQQRMLDDFMRKLGYVPQAKENPDQQPLAGNDAVDVTFKKIMEELKRHGHAEISRGFIIDLQSGKGIKELCSFLDAISPIVKGKSSEKTASGAGIASHGEDHLLDLFSRLKKAGW